MFISPESIISENRAFIVDFLDENCEFENRYARHKVLMLSELDNGILLTAAQTVGGHILLKTFEKERKRRQELKETEKSKGDVDKIKWYDFGKMEDCIKGDIQRLTLTPDRRKIAYWALETAAKLRRAVQSLKSFFTKAFEKGFILAQKLYQYLVCDIVKRHFNILAYIHRKGKDDLIQSKCSEQAISKFFVAYEAGLFDKLDKEANQLSGTQINNAVGVAIGATLATGYILYKGILIMVEIVRLMVYSFYYLREKLSTYLQLNAEYVRMNSKLNKDEQVKKDQSKWADRLEKYAKKISVEEKESDYQAQKEIEKDKVQLDKEGQVAKKNNNENNDSDEGSNDDVGLVF